MEMLVWDEKRVEVCLNKLTVFLKIENHIIKFHPKNPRAGADLAARFKKEILPEIVSDVTAVLSDKQLHGDATSEDVVIRELNARLNTELVRLGVAMTPSFSQ
jgi:hypothetical protein